ncbi:MAG TPA: hypothetical protein VHM66_01525 [Solirubrobacterales bacterium]|nr:hypothetical protein [Solirubrobacterales bacterium]
MALEIDIPAGPVADKLTLWPVDDGRYGLDAVFQGVSGYERCEEHRVGLKAAGVDCKMLQNLDNSWSLRFGPLTAHEVGRAVSAFVR